MHPFFMRDVRRLCYALLLLAISIALFGAEQRPLVINQTTGKDEQLQTSNALSAGVIASGSTANRTLQARAAEWVNVLDFGAVADGNWNAGTGTDNGPAFAAAIASRTTSQTVSFGVFVPPGVYRIGTRVDIPSGVSFVGAGPWATLLFSANAYASDIIRANGAGGMPTTISSMCVTGQVGGSFSATGINAATNGVFLDLLWVNGFGTGVVLSSTDQLMSNFAVELCTTGISVSGNNINVAGGTCYANAYGVVVSNGASTGTGRVMVSNVRATEGTQEGFVITDAKSVVLNACSATHDNPGRFPVAGFSIEGSSTEVTLTGCSAVIGSTASTTADGIRITGTASLVNINGGTIKGWLNGINITTSGYAILVNGVNVTGNGAVGINANWAGGQLSILGCVSTNNGTAAGGDCGINVTSGGPFGNLVVSGNIVDQGGGGPQEYGIQITNNNASTKGVCQGNVVANSTMADYNITGTSSANIIVTGANN